MGPPLSEDGCPQDDVPLPTLSSISFASGVSYAQIILSPPLTLGPRKGQKHPSTTPHGWASGPRFHQY